MKISGGNMDFDWKSVVKTIAPTLGTALLGPLGGIAVSAIGGILGLGTDPTDQQLTDAMGKLTPDQILAIKQEDNRFKAEMAQKGIDLNALKVEKHKNAIEREIKTGDSWTPRMLALSAALFFLVNIVGDFLLIAFQVKIGTDGGYLLGSCNTASVALLKAVYDYYFGGNSSSEATNNLLYKSTPPGGIGKTSMDAMPGIKVIPKN